MRRRVVVTGMGCLSPVGNNVQETWDSILAGKSGAAMITHFDASKHKTRFAAEVKGFDGVALFGPRETRQDGSFYPICGLRGPGSVGAGWTGDQ